ncbi:hypothetical protein [Metabacillus indicus]|uniref:Uncharacterized protein n=1 Tax=Metabacillus indicus TaxID=246786 RepID=A0A084H227_METID|nr:hypothetical protein [Metabacillus indicus]KEZ52443.1 hypothetical protein AZ46_0201260 [Metabacillus indicus LMG 22858]KEZ53639.1 hypothetical protein GS18_0201255 [Metabacillus indicus]
MNYKNYEKKHVFGVIGFLILILIPYSSILFPFMVADVLYATNLTWFIQLSNGTYFLYGAGFLMWAIAALIAAFRKADRTSLISGLIIIFLSIVPFTIGAIQHKQLSDEGISFSRGIEQHQYTWDEVESAVFHLSKEKGEPSVIEIEFKDGESVSLLKDKHFTANYSLFLQKVKYHEIAFTGDHAS